jgi:putative transposase
LSKYAVKASNKKLWVWQLDSLAVVLYSIPVMQQKMHYIHMNPLAGYWQLAKAPADYYWLSAKFYETGIMDLVF